MAELHGRRCLLARLRLLSVLPISILSGTESMGVLRSVDGGRTWEQALSSDVDVNALDACFDNYVWAAGSDGVMYVSADGLATSDEIHPADGGYSSGTLSSVAFLRDALRGACSVLSYTGETGTIPYCPIRERPVPYIIRWTEACHGIKVRCLMNSGWNLWILLAEATSLARSL